jgi:uncharacterized protein (DUF3820 family)
MKAVPLNDGNNYEIPVGKYKGQNIADIYDEDPSYFEWLYDNVPLEKDYPQFFGILENMILTGCPF